MKHIEYFKDYNECIHTLEQLYTLNPCVYNMCYLMSVSAMQLSDLVLLTHNHIMELPSGRCVIIYKKLPYIHLSDLFMRSVMNEFRPNNMLYLFPSKDGTTHITSQTAKSQIESCLKKLSIDATPTLFRLSYAYHYLKTNHTLRHSGLDHLMRNKEKLLNIFSITADEYDELVSCEQKKCSTPELHTICQTISDAMQIIANPIHDDAVRASVDFIDELADTCNHYRNYIVSIEEDG